MIKIGDAAVDEQKVVETQPISSNDEKEESTAEKSQLLQKNQNQKHNPEEPLEHNLQKNKKKKRPKCLKTTFT